MTQRGSEQLHPLCPARAGRWRRDCSHVVRIGRRLPRVRGGQFRSRQYRDVRRIHLSGPSDEGTVPTDRAGSTRVRDGRSGVWSRHSSIIRPGCGDGGVTGTADVFGCIPYASKRPRPGQGRGDHRRDAYSSGGDCLPIWDVADLSAEHAAAGDSVPICGHRRADRPNSSRWHRGCPGNSVVGGLPLSSRRLVDSSCRRE